MSVMECKQRSFSAVRRKTLLNTEEEERPRALTPHKHIANARLVEARRRRTGSHAK